MLTISRGEPPRTGGSKDVDAVALVHAKSTVTRGDLQAELLILNEADVCVTTELRVLPGLVDSSLLAVNNLLDLLDLIVNLDQVAVTKGLCVSELLGAAAENVVDGLDVGSRGADEAILCCWVYARNCLAVLLLVALGLNCVGALLVRLGLGDQLFEVGSLHNVAHVVNACDVGQTVKRHEK